ncbi:MAG: CPBP family intramembrane metalloprotease [Phycisphaerae bacterium]|nr:CPBP family intramembrane metalloprotease [Saprospiraceae bacterium]
MQDNDLLNEQDFPPSTPSLPEPRVRLVLLAQIGLMIFCSGIGVLLYYFICTLAGWDVSTALSADSPMAERWQVRLQLGLTHMFGFLVAGSVTVWVFYRGITQSAMSWPDYLQTRRWPRWTELFLGVLLMGVSLPLVLYSLSINQQLPLPELFKEASAQAEEALKGLLHMDNGAELLANIVIIALLPALGEELVFRGVIQQQLMRRIANPWVAILVSALVFSAAHFQFEGFLPRVLLGFLLGWLYWRTRNFWVPVVGHFFNNGIQVFGQYLYGKEMSAIDLEKDIQVPWEFAAISAFMIWAVMRLIGQLSKN